MSEFRRRLYEITENGAPDTHPRLIAELKDEFPHAIETAASDAPIGTYTCVMHALDLIENDEYIGIVNAAPKYVFASPAFVQRLIARGQLQSLAAPKPGALAVYSQDGCVTHIGRLIDLDRVESKWGAGHLYCHGTMEIPMNYGSEVRYFEHLDRERALHRFVEYAKEHGVPFEGDA